MTEFMQYAYVFLWVALAALTFFIGRKQGVLGYFMSLFFVFLSVWYGLRDFFGLPVFEGWLGFAFRGVLLAFLVLIVVVWYRGRKRENESARTHDGEHHCDDPHCDCHHHEK